jgi:hypothetical protein
MARIGCSVLSDHHATNSIHSEPPQIHRHTDTQPSSETQWRTDIMRASHCRLVGVVEWGAETHTLIGAGEYKRNMATSRAQMLEASERVVQTHLVATLPDAIRVVGTQRPDQRHPTSKNRKVPVKFQIEVWQFGQLRMASCCVQCHVLPIFGMSCLSSPLPLSSSSSSSSSVRVTSQPRSNQLLGCDCDCDRLRLTIPS